MHLSVTCNAYPIPRSRFPFAWMLCRPGVQNLLPRPPPWTEHSRRPCSRYACFDEYSFYISKPLLSLLLVQTSRFLAILGHFKKFVQMRGFSRITGSLQIIPGLENGIYKLRGAINLSLFAIHLFSRIKHPMVFKSISKHSVLWSWRNLCVRG